MAVEPETKIYIIIIINICNYLVHLLRRGRNNITNIIPLFKKPIILYINSLQ